MRFLLCPLLCVASFVLTANADPLLSFQQPIADQLNTDLLATPGDKTLNSALNTFHKTSKSLSSDISILRSLDKLLADRAGYGSLLDDAANDYQADFQSRRDAIDQQLIPAPISVNKTTARSSIASLDKAISNSVNAASTELRITRLKTVATRLTSASNAVQRALNTPLGFSSMVAHIGALSFNTSKGSIVSSASFQTTDGNFIGGYTTNGTLFLSGFQPGSIGRGIALYVQNIVTNVPATYPLGVDGNMASYNATDSRHKLSYFFEATPQLTNSIVTNSFLSIEFIGTNYLIGRFAFVGTNTAPFDVTDTNQVVTVSQGEFQVNFRRPSPAEPEEPPAASPARRIP